VNTDQAQLAADSLGLQCGVPGLRYVPGMRIMSLQGCKPATVIAMHGGNVVAKADDGEDLVLAYYKIGIPKATKAA